jgi:hypothetical protein
MVSTSFHGISIDTPEDLIKAENLISKKWLKYYQNLF